MIENNILNDVRSPPENLALAMRITVDQMMHDYSHEERMFWAIQYAIGEYSRIDDPEYDMTDYRIKAEQLAESFVEEQNGSMPKVAFEPNPE